MENLTISIEEGQVYDYRAVVTDEDGVEGVFYEANDASGAAAEAVKAFGRLRGSAPVPSPVRLHSPAFILAALRVAARDSTEVRIGYTDSSHNYTERTIKPNKIEPGPWGDSATVYAYDVTRDGIRQFKVDRIDYLEKDA